MDLLSAVHEILAIALADPAFVNIENVRLRFADDGDMAFVYT